MKDSKPYEISKQVVMTAYQKIKAHRGICDVVGRLQFNFLSSVSRKSAKAFRDKLRSGDG